MAEEEKVFIEYQDQKLVAKYGARPIRVSRDMGNRMASKGWAKIVGGLQANPDLTEKEMEEEEQRKNEVNFHLETEKFMEKISWITGGYLNRQLSDTAMKFGFKINICSPGYFSVGQLLLSDLIILDNNLEAFSYANLVDIKAVLFQKRKPYVFRICKRSDEIQWQKQAMMHSRLNIFETEELFNDYLDFCEESLDDRWLVVEKLNNYYVEFWQYVDKILKKEKI